MEVAVPHSLPRDEVHRRIDSRIGDLRSFVPGGAADIQHQWRDDYHLDFSITAMGQAIDGKIEIEQQAVQIIVNLPLALSFVEPMIAPTIREKGAKLLANTTDA